MKLPLLGGIVALVVVIVDQIAKIAILSRSDQLAADPAPLTPFLDLTLRWNRGISFSLFARDSASAESVLLALTLAAIVSLANVFSLGELTHFLLYMNCTVSGQLFGARPEDVTLAVLPFFHVFGVLLLIIDLLPIARAPDSRSQRNPPHGAS